ncbi:MULTISPECIES: 5-(carboxyamino)imidazole ribonucleotide synthase [Paraliobacillus]|uniref:5-(carboxyamino)imidazole ribonucleotide synthase n=1 Tax=Paraliobacillus TaxID=200903 RepID=UPI000DD31221|nr:MULTISPECIES: 5-(carboxyamino)imidazole ribonucleotide synthase [Paraliobacillus]
MQSNKLLFGSTIGIIGGGQLGRMMATTAKHMGYSIVVLDPTPDCPAAQVADQQLVAAYNDRDAIVQLTDICDVITYEFENVDLEAARYIEERGLLPQGSTSLKITQDREQEKNAIVQSSQPVASFKIVETKLEVQQAIESIGFPAVIKTCRGGYDGKGQQKLEALEDMEKAIEFVDVNGRSIVEKWVAFDKEISIIFTRGHDGDVTFFPIAENTHKDHVLQTTSVPAEISEKVADKAREAAKSIAETIGVIGTFAIEMFVDGEAILINEMAPRPHNSGHYTIEACNVSQFEQHIRAICGLPLIDIHFHGAAIMINLLGEDVARFMERIDEIGDAHIHMYGKKENKPKRKMGHVTYIGNELAKLEQNLVNKRIIHKNQEVISND